MVRTVGTETLYLDERGTPLLGIDGDRRLVVGGFAARGDIAELETAWRAAKNAHPSLKRKGKTFGEAEFLAIASFVAEHSLLPVTSFASLTDEEEARLRERLEFEAKVPSSAANYVWALQMGMTVGCATAAFAMRRGPLSGVRVNIDQMSIKKEVQAVLENYLGTWISDPAKIRKILDAADARFPGAPALQTMRANLGEESYDSSVSLKARGDLPSLADGMCSLYGKALEGDPGAARAWNVLCTAAKGAHPTMPPCMNLDLSAAMRAGATGKR